MASQTSPLSSKSSKKIPRVTRPEMVPIPEGDTLMGTSDDQVEALLAKEDWAEEWYEHDLFRIEQPQHRIFVPAFELARLPVTNAEYHLFIWDTGHRVPREWPSFKYLEEEADHPVAGVSRADALAYCRWLSTKFGETYRLPTEAEWERAARSDDDRIYPWGSDFDPWRCNTAESGRRSTTPVGMFSPSGDSLWGVSDMTGNVWEWTSSLLKPYPYVAGDGRENLDSREIVVVRGGSWYYTRKLARCSSREGFLPTFTSPALGFRLARTPRE